MARKTWTWLSGRKRPPGEYEELSTGMQWATPSLMRTVIGTWDPDSTVLRADWNQFRDPAGLYYRTYVTGQDAVERSLDSVFAVAKEADFITGLDPAWRESLTCLVGAMSFAQWGIAMAQQHVQRFCLSPTIAQSSQLQVMDKLRNAERDLEWYDLLVGEDAPEDAVRTEWTQAPAMQPLRKYIEEALIVADWAEVIVAINLALAGVLEPFLREVYIRGGQTHHDFVTSALGSSIAKDSKRHVQWTDAFVKFCLAEEGNAAAIGDWLDRFLPAAVSAVEAVASAHPLNGLTAEAVFVARNELRSRLDTLDVKLTGAVDAALDPDSDRAPQPVDVVARRS
jgi:phenol hydroxylase P1 protein